MFGKKASNKPASVPNKGQARGQRGSISKRNKSVSSTIAVYGTSTIVGKAKAN